MARPKKVKKEEIVEAIETPAMVEPAEVQPAQVVPTPIAPLSVDYPSEGLNDMARKINEIISRL